MKFDSTYYDKIWGTLHRHDYCEDLALMLRNKYGSGSKLLDVGTGCGYLVKCLRDLGVEAWGCDVSPYAVENSCSPFVKLGDVTEVLPFKTGEFDVVHSQGLWGYQPDITSIQSAWAECKRVGRSQHHNIDTSDNGEVDPDHGYLIWQSHQWWKDQFYPRVLVACPTHKVKAYAWARWSECVHNLSYPNFDTLVVDNSPEPFFKSSGKINVKHLPISGGAVRRINQSMEEIRQTFLVSGYTYWMNIEADNIPPSDVIERLMAVNVDWASHAYPMRGETQDVQQGIGCSLLSRRLIETFGFADADDNYTPDGWLWNRVRPEGSRFKTAELWGHFTVEHLKS